MRHVKVPFPETKILTDLENKPSRSTTQGGSCHSEVEQLPGMQGSCSSPVAQGVGQEGRMLAEAPEAHLLSDL